MLVATKTSVYYIPSDGSKEPLLLFRNNEIRRVAEGLDRNVVTLSNGKILVLKDNEQLEICQVIPDRIDSLCIIEEDPLNILIGCTPPNLYRLREGEEEAKLNLSFEGLDFAATGSHHGEDHLQ